MKLNQFSVLVLLASIFVSPVHMSTASAKQAPEVRLIENEWTSQAIITRITGLLLEHLGYKATRIVAHSDQQWGLFKYRKIDLQMELWEGTMSTKYQQAMASGLIIDLGDHQAKTQEDWWYPEYVEELCPGLPDWQALKQCWKIFVHPDTQPYARYLTGPWEKPDFARIKALELNFKVKRTTESGLVEALKEFSKTKRPILLFNWSPNWVQLKYPGKFVNFPDWAPECENDVSWGINPTLPFDCGNPKTGWLKKVAISGFDLSHKCAAELIRNIDFDANTIGSFPLKHSEGLSKQEVAQDWVQNNQKIWKAWMPKTCSVSG